MMIIMMIKIIIIMIQSLSTGFARDPMKLCFT